MKLSSYAYASEWDNISTTSALEEHVTEQMMNQLAAENIKTVLITLCFSSPLVHCVECLPQFLWNMHIARLFNSLV